MKKYFVGVFVLATLLLSLSGSFKAVTALDLRPSEMVLENRSTAAVLYVIRKSVGTQTGCLTHPSGHVTVHQNQMLAVRFTFMASNTCNGRPLQPSEVHPFTEPKTVYTMHGRGGSNYAITVTH